MNIDELKSSWDKSGANKKSHTELKMMTKIQTHPKLNRIRLRLIIESMLLILFLGAYSSIFDGQDKPLWVNIVLVSSAVLFILTDFLGYLTIQNPIRGKDIKTSLLKFYSTLKRLSVLSLSASLLFGSSVILFFSSTINFTTEKYFFLTGMILSMLIISWLSYKNWLNRINQIKDASSDFTNLNE